MEMKLSSALGHLDWLSLVIADRVDRGNGGECAWTINITSSISPTVPDDLHSNEDEQVEAFSQKACG
jgi:hypothetical protein